MAQPEPVLAFARQRKVWHLAAPIILALSSQNLMNLVDTAMVGTLGKTALAGVGFAGMMLWAVVAVFQGLSPAVQTQTARRLGEGDSARLHQSMVNSLYLAVGFGIPYTWLLFTSAAPLFHFFNDDPAVCTLGGEYFQIRALSLVFMGVNFGFRGFFNGIKKPNLYMQTLLMMHPINILLNYLLIFGIAGLPRLETNGAALGTLIATILGTLNYIRLFLKHREPGATLHWKAVDLGGMKSLLRQAIPNCFQSFSLALGFMLYFVIAGKISTDALAATSVLIRLALLCTLIGLGFGIATLTLVGHAVGEGQPDEARRWVHTALFMTCTTLTLIGACFALFPAFFLDWFIQEPAVIHIALTPMVLMGLSQSYDAAAIVLMHAHLGGGSARRVLVISFVNQWLLFLPASYAAVTWGGFDLTGLWVCMISYRFLLFLTFVASLTQGNWIRAQV
ncbi:MATE family efflux transporter [Acanthopleuribacter pedis]|uniref:Multidrug-efflux transporter n=1 Tax=Acanthopleuribacter pedis TaxID=442870 RepID=A0A8J7U532_9BACT|nr:MATE family efflux transporter [Acanthopleuribacter pedis]MBO1318906.1 MATE family efflux transporter [Acanthopleuribacter pedis]